MKKVVIALLTLITYTTAIYADKCDFLWIKMNVDSPNEKVRITLPFPAAFAKTVLREAIYWSINSCKESDRSNVEQCHVVLGPFTKGKEQIILPEDGDVVLEVEEKDGTKAKIFIEKNFYEFILTAKQVEFPTGELLTINAYDPSQKENAHISIACR